MNDHRNGDEKPPIRARRSRYTGAGAERPGYERPRTQWSSPRGNARARARAPRRSASGGFRMPPITGRRVGAVLLAVVIVVLGVFAWRTVNFLHDSLNVGNPIDQIHPAAGSVAWKVQRGEPVNLLLVGYGGTQNDAPYLTDSIMVLRLDTANHHAVEASIPRDLNVTYQVNGQTVDNKINTAYSNAMYDLPPSDKDRGGKLAMQVVSQVTGLHLDGYVGVDFAAFRDIVNALGGIDVCLSSPLDDTQYPNYSDGYMKGGIHFKAGCQHVNGEQALEIARSRHATEPSQASDFARAQRQQLIIEGIRKKATSINAITQAPAIMNAVQKDMSTDLTLTDLTAIYDWSKSVDSSQTARVSIDTDNFLNVCGNYYLCPNDQSYAQLHQYFGALLVPPAASKEKATVQVVNGSYSLDQMGSQVTSALSMIGFHTAPTIRDSPQASSVLYDTSGGKDPQTVQWLASYYGAKVVKGQPPVSGTQPGALVLVLGRDYSVRWIGQTS
ncbi:MAG: LCP family protein [Candidatus Dormiibacterota bacterium]